MQRFYLPVFKGPYAPEKQQDFTNESPLYDSKVELAKDIKNGELFGELNYVLEIQPMKGTVNDITKDIAQIIADLYEIRGETPSWDMQILFDELEIEYEEWSAE